MQFRVPEGGRGGGLPAVLLLLLLTGAGAATAAATTARAVLWLLGSLGSKVGCNKRAEG